MMRALMFAIADTNGDGRLSFDEVSAIHKRNFDWVDANKDGKVTVEEAQGFMLSSDNAAFVRFLHNLREGMAAREDSRLSQSRVILLIEA